MDLSKNRAAFLARLKNKKFRTDSGLFMAEGDKCVKDLMPAFELVELIVTKTKLPSLNISLNEEKIKIANPDLMKKISALTTPSDIIGIFKIPSDNSENLKLSNDTLYLFLDDIQDPGNMGTLIRTADWFGIRKVFISTGSADVYNPKTVQSTMGSLARVKVVRTDLEKVIEINNDIPIIGTMLEGKNIYTSNYPSSGIVIMGNEGKGISPNLQKHLTCALTIPPFDPSGAPDSLNVGVACGIVLAFMRKNQTGKTNGL